MLDTTKHYTLENERVLLRPLTAADRVHFVQFSQDEPELWKFSLVGAAGDSALDYYMQLALDNHQKGIEYPFIVFDKQTQEYAGSTRFYDINNAFQTVQLGYTWYGKKFQGTGLNKHCKMLLFSFAFEQLDMLRVELRADNENKRSIAAMKRIGCVEEGILRQNMPRPGTGRRDSIVLSMLQEEWLNGGKTVLQKQIDGLH
ncbi:MAG: GNAT family N-acetyltransferase [Bacteroidia bacterium]